MLLHYKQSFGVDAKASHDDGFQATPLVFAASIGNTELARVFIENGADVNAQDLHGQTALKHAAYQGRIELAEKLLEKGADINFKET
jgi:ankyrin repeat protein